MNTSLLSALRRMADGAQRYESASVFADQTQAEDHVYAAVETYAQLKGISQEQADQTLSDAFEKLHDRLVTDRRRATGRAQV